VADIVVAVGTAAAGMVVVVGSTVVAVALVVDAIAAVDIANTGLVVVALFSPLSTLLHILSIKCVYYYNATHGCQ